MDANVLPVNGVSPCRRKLDFAEETSTFMEEDPEPNDCMVLSATENNSLLDENSLKPQIPHIGMEFGNETEAYQFYQAYARAIGFGTRIGKGHKDPNSGIMLDRIFCCAREGKRGKDKRAFKVKRPRAETRCNCKAMMKINCRLTGKYRVVQFVAEHKHELCSPNKSHLFRSFRKVTKAQAAQIDMATSCGITPKQTLDFMASQVGGKDNLGFTRVDCKNYLRSKRMEIARPGDTGGVLEYLQKMQLEDPSSFYAIQLDTEDMVTNILWFDGKMRADYSKFGDVVCFDTTYRKNKEGRPIAIFVGVNHHKQSVVFGFALLYDETTETFEWLFETFAKAMGQQPQTMLTDQCKAMMNALVSKWPGTYHRLCVWHIYQNAASNLSGVFSRFDDFTSDFKDCIYNHDEEEDFINAWNQLLEKYGLQENEWLKKMFGMKEKWALVYGRSTFCADMSTTQRSESINSMVKKYVSYKNDLLQCFGHFQRLLNDRRYDELEADFIASQSAPVLSYSMEIMKHAASTYTPAVFEKIKSEICKAYDCRAELWGQNDNITEYKVNAHGKSQSHLVMYKSFDDSIWCSCRKFEFVGILCCHAFKVFSMHNIFKIPSPYILKRWTKKAKQGKVEVANSNMSTGDPKAKMSLRYKELCQLCTQLASKAAEEESTFIFTKDCILKMFEEVDKMLERTEMAGPFLVSPDLEKSIFLPHKVEESRARPVKVSGIKIKEKVTCRTSRRPKNPLERATKKRKNRSKGKLASTYENINLLETSIGNDVDSNGMAVDVPEIPGPSSEP